MKAETAVLASATVAAGGFTLLGGSVFGIEKAVLWGALIGTLFAVSAIKSVKDWRRWLAIVASLLTGVVSAHFLAALIRSALIKAEMLSDGVTIADGPMLATSAIVTSFLAQTMLSWVGRKIFGNDDKGGVNG